MGSWVGVAGCPPLGRCCELTPGSWTPGGSPLVLVPDAQVDVCHGCHDGLVVVLHQQHRLIRICVQETVVASEPSCISNDALARFNRATIACGHMNAVLACLGAHSHDLIAATCLWQDNLICMR